MTMAFPDMVECHRCGNFIDRDGSFSFDGSGFCFCKECFVDRIRELSEFHLQGAVLASVIVAIDDLGEWRVGKAGQEKTLQLTFHYKRNVEFHRFDFTVPVPKAKVT